MASTELANFGENLVFTPEFIERPQSESEVLELLARHRGKRIRVVGSLHSWSRAPEADEVFVDVAALNQVELREDQGETLARVGAGCQIKRVLDELDQHALTLPSVGLISEQTFAGATATATHGSGKHALSHYVEAVRLAHYDASGTPVIREITSGPELDAARCSLGCLGIILTLDVKPRPAYQVEEWLAWHDRPTSAMAALVEAPLSHFLYIPWRDQYLGQQRREVDQPPSWQAAWYKRYWFAAVDVGLHCLLILFVQILRSGWLVKNFYAWLVGWTIPTHWRVVGRSPDMLIMEHELFRHIEIELFVRRSVVTDALEYVRKAVHCFDDPTLPVPEGTPANLAADFAAWREDGSGVRTHHYPVCVRRVFHDQTMLSMTSGDETFYAISIISYALPSERESFHRFAEFLERGMGALFDARCHWGKVCPHRPETIARLYPRLGEFRQVCRELDPDGVFRNAWLDTALGFSVDRVSRPIPARSVSAPSQPEA